MKVFLLEIYDEKNGGFEDYGYQKPFANKADAVSELLETVREDYNIPKRYDICKWMREHYDVKIPLTSEYIGVHNSEEPKYVKYYVIKTFEM